MTTPIFNCLQDVIRFVNICPTCRKTTFIASDNLDPAQVGDTTVLANVHEEAVTLATHCVCPGGPCAHQGIIPEKCECEGEPTMAWDEHTFHLYCIRCGGALPLTNKEPKPITDEEADQQEVDDMRALAHLQRYGY